jgi:cytochrome c oxidase assembly protein subunit 15
MKNKAILWWLIISAILVFVMIALGGLTRLTNSGLSMVEWQLFTLLPPLGEKAWLVEFNKYQTSPEFKLINVGMDLAGFKAIFWLEYAHRILGKFIGIFIILPAAYGYIKKYFTNETWPIIICALVMMQGLLGWYMVKSGLINNPHVSHYNLASHLFCAAILYSVIIWRILVYSPCTNRPTAILPGISPLLNCLLALTFLQIIMGAFVAGLKAGLVYNQFPLMGESFIPIELNYWNINLLSDPVFIQFLHRIIAYLILALSLITSYKLYTYKLHNYAIMLLLAPLAQTILGIVALIYHVPLVIALLHQSGSIVLLSVILFIRYCSTPENQYSVTKAL